MVTHLLSHCQSFPPPRLTPPSPLPSPFLPPISLSPLPSSSFSATSCVPAPIDERMSASIQITRARLPLLSAKQSDQSHFMMVLACREKREGSQRRDWMETWTYTGITQCSRTHRPSSPLWSLCRATAQTRRRRPILLVARIPPLPPRRHRAS